MTLLEIAAELHRLGNQVRESLPEPFPRDEGNGPPDIRAAAEKLAAVLPTKTSYSISFSYWPTMSREHRVDWTIYDGKKSHTANSLAQAVNDCLAAHTPEPETQPDTIAQVEGMLQAACAPF